MSAAPDTASATHAPAPPHAGHAVAHHFDDAAQQRGAAELGMWVFLATEVLFFGGLLVAYAIYHRTYPHAFAAGSAHLDLWAGAINTAVLLTSSLTMALAVHAVATDRSRRAVALLVATMALGVVFLGIKGYEYRHKFVDHLVPGPTFVGRTATAAATQLEADADDDNNAVEERSEVTTHAGGAAGPRSEGGAMELFFSLYFALTGLHAVHMIIGIGVVAVMTVLTARGRFAGGYDTPVEVTGLYWHFVDIVWIFLYPLLYLLH